MSGEPGPFGRNRLGTLGRRSFLFGASATFLLAARSFRANPSRPTNKPSPKSPASRMLVSGSTAARPSSGTSCAERRLLPQPGPQRVSTSSRCPAALMTALLALVSSAAGPRRYPPQIHLRDRRERRRAYRPAGLSGP